jgi:hypothetical protein
MIKRITKIVQSMVQLLSGCKHIKSNRLSTQCLSLVCLARLFFFFHSGVNRAASMAQKFLAFFDDCFAGLAQLVSLLT